MPAPDEEQAPEREFDGLAAHLERTPLGRGAVRSALADVEDTLREDQ